MKFNHLVISVMLVTTGCAVRPGGTDRQHRAERDHSAAETLELQNGHRGAAEFKDQLSRNRAVTFRNFDGKHQGMEGDVDLRFFPNGKVKMAVKTMEMVTYAGFYEVDAEGRIVMTAGELGRPFPEMPAMVLNRGDKCLMLAPHAGKNAGGFWSFRMISPKEKSSLND